MQLLLDAQTSDASQISTDGLHVDELDHLKIEKKLTAEVKLLSQFEILNKN